MTIGTRTRLDANIAGSPATPMPIASHAAGLPIGLQAMGPAGGDKTTIEFAALLTEIIGGYQIPPRSRARQSQIPTAVS